MGCRRSDLAKIHPPHGIALEQGTIVDSRQIGDSETHRGCDQRMGYD